MKLGGSSTKHLKQGRLSRIQHLSLSAHHIPFLTLVQLEHNLSFHQARGDAQSAQLRLNCMADWFVVGCWDLAGTGVHQAVGDGESAGGFRSGARKVSGTEVFEVADDGLGIPRGEQETDGAG